MQALKLWTFAPCHILIVLQSACWQPSNMLRWVLKAPLLLMFVEFTYDYFYRSRIHPFIRSISHKFASLLVWLENSTHFMGTFVWYKSHVKCVLSRLFFSSFSFMKSEHLLEFFKTSTRVVCIIPRTVNWTSQNFARRWPLLYLLICYAEWVFKHKVDVKFRGCWLWNYYKALSSSRGPKQEAFSEILRSPVDTSNVFHF